jgi:hypothetical protein
MATADAKDGVAPRPAIADFRLPIIAVALALFAIRLITAVRDPFFEGDGGQRLHLAHLPVAGVGNRIWLPFLQAQIWALYRLHLPYYTFKIIPCFYFFIAVVFLGLLTYRQTGRRTDRRTVGQTGSMRGDLMFTLIVVICFAYQWEVQWISTRLYQESLALAGFYVLLWGGAVELRDNKWLLPIAAAALLTRECLWIYLLAICWLNRREILASKRYRIVFGALWSIPVLWMLATLWAHRHLEGRLPTSAAEWPLGINKAGGMAVSHFAGSVASLGASLIASRSIALVVALIVVGIIGRRQRAAGEAGAASAHDATSVHGHDAAGAASAAERLNPLDTLDMQDADGTRAEEAVDTRRELFDSRFRPFSLLSLAIIYALIVLFNPWEATFANQRIDIPLLGQAFVWSGLLYRDTYDFAPRARVWSRIVLITGLVLSLNLNLRTWIYRDEAHASRTVAEVAQLVASTGRSRPANVCVIKENYWEAIERFAGPTLYAQLIINPKTQTNPKDETNPKNQTNPKPGPNPKGQTNARGPTISNEPVPSNEPTVPGGTCDLLLTRTGTAFASSDTFEKYGDYELLGRSYVAYRRTSSLGAPQNGIPQP